VRSRDCACYNAAVDDDGIRRLTEEVLAELRKPAAPAELETRLAALERAVNDLQGGRAVAPGAPSPRPAVPVHAAFQIVAVAGHVEHADRCVLEPDKPCVGSQACKTFGH
jgi:hypothetical protein